MSDRYHNNLPLDDVMKDRMENYEYNDAVRAVEPNIENERMSDISSGSFSSKREEDQDDDEEDQDGGEEEEMEMEKERGEEIEEENDGLSASSLEEMNEEVIPSGASFLIGERPLLASSALSRASSREDGVTSPHEPIASRFLRSNNTWAHRDHLLNHDYRRSWNSGQQNHSHRSHSNSHSNPNHYGQRNGGYPRNRPSRQSGSSFSPLSYAEDSHDQQLKSLAQLQNEALGSWLRLRPRNDPQAQSCVPYFTPNSHFQHQQQQQQQQQQRDHDERLCYPKYPVTMVTGSLGESRFLNNSSSYQLSEQEDQQRMQQSRHTRYSEISNQAVLDETLHRRNFGGALYSKDQIAENGTDVIEEHVQTISIPNEDNNDNDDTDDGENEELDLGVEDLGENRSIEKNNSIKELSERQSTSTTAQNVNWASPDSKYETYICRADRHQGDKAQEILLFLFVRPHMRAFHFAWFSFFVAFFIWFAISPLLAEIRDSLDLSHEQIWTSNTYGSAGTIFFRLLAGPLCDTYGARTIMALCLVLGALPVMATGLVHNATELYIVRLLSGISGASFVICQYWTSSMFVREIAGTANSLASGWGNLGGGVAQIVMGSVLFPLFKVIYGPDNSDSAWRSMFILPAVGGIATAFCIMKYSDDTPKGNYRKLSRLGIAPKAKIMKSFRLASSNPNTWFLFVQYACCFGVEVTMTTGAALYFIDQYDQSTESAAALASIFGWLNLFARGLGGFISDIMNVKMGMRGRLLWQMVSLVAEGAMIICFGYSTTLASSICTMVAFSLFVQTSEGSTYSIVPYVCPRATGSVAGIVGAGGNVGGVVYLFLITKLNYSKGFVYMGWSVICSSLLCFIVNIQGYSKGLRKLDNSELIPSDESDLNVHENESNDDMGDKQGENAREVCRNEKDVEHGNGDKKGSKGSN